MDDRAAHLIATLQLEPHPEGGYYRQTYRSASLVNPQDIRSERASLTTIYFLLPAGDVSRWHTVASDEVWHFYEGAPLELMTADRDFGEIQRHRLGPVAPGVEPVHVVRAHEWQAARSEGAFTLVGCTVGPGFEFPDFRLLRNDPAKADEVRGRHADAAPLI
jgi:predicted cupin superfamily sugar epimerase